jgi:hypothetical protein
MEATFYGGGLRLGLERGRLSVKDWNPTVEERGDAAFPDLTFLQLVFGHRTLEELDSPSQTVHRGGRRASTAGIPVPQASLRLMAHLLRP